MKLNLYKPSESAMRYLILLITLFALPSWANGSHEDTSGQEQGQTQGQSQGQTQTSATETNVDTDVSLSNYSSGGRGGDATGTGGNASISIQAKDNTPTVIGGYIAPSDPCMGGVNGSVALPGLGVGGGKTTINPDCERREWFRIHMQAGNTEVAMKIFCASPYSHEAGMEYCEGYRTAPKGWEEETPNPDMRDYSQFNKQFTAEECDERESRKDSVGCVSK